MSTVIRAVLTVAFVVALAWPLLFWGKMALPEQNGSGIRYLPSHTRQEVLW